MSSNTPSRQIASPHVNSDEKDSDETKIKVEQFPEGGSAAWCTVIGAALVQFCSVGYATSFGVYQDFYTLQYLTNKSSAAISWIGAIAACMITSLSLAAGVLYDRGYFYHLVIGGSLLQSFALFMLSLTKQGQYYQIILVQGICLGAGQGLMYVPTVAVVSHYFHRRRTLAMSLVTSGSSIGAIVHPVMLNYLFNGSVGFANGVRISATFISALLLITCFLMRTRLEPPKCTVNYLSVGRGIIHDVPFCLMAVGALCFQVAFYYPLYYLQLDSVKHGNSETFSFYSFVFVNGGSFIGRLSAGFIAPYIGVPGLSIIATSLSGVVILGMIGLSNDVTVVVLGVLYGYFCGIFVALMSPLMALLTSDFSEIGARMGIGIMILGIGGLFGGPLSGELLTSQYKWWQPSLFSGLIALAGSSFLIMMQLMLIRRRKCGSATAIIP